MERHRAAFVALNVLGGLAVLGSYWWGLSGYPELAEALWGGVPPWLRPVYTVTMVAAALGYFPFTGYFLLRYRAGDDETREGAGPGFVLLLYGLILVPSALWLPLTLGYLHSPGLGLWWLIRLDLLAVGVGAVGLLVTLVQARPHRIGPWYVLAIVGLLVFCLQTAVLDALVWPALFHTA